MHITKSLFVEYLSFPKIARRKANDPAIYKKINGLETAEQEEYIMNLGQTVENAVRELLESRYATTALDLMPDWHRDDEVDEDDDDVFAQPIRTIEESISRTLDAIAAWQQLLYQPTFRLGECLVRADFMVREHDGSYHLIEVKAKSWIRKKIIDDGESKPIGAIEDQFQHDISFQVYVINTVLQQAWLPPLSRASFAYLNKDYRRQGPLDLEQLIVFDETGWSREIEVIQGKKPTAKTKIIDDTLMHPTTIQQYIHKMWSELSLSEHEFNALHPFPGNKYVPYFGQERPFGTIVWMGVNGNPIVVRDLYEQWKTDIMTLTEDEKDLFHTQNGVGKAREFIDNYSYCVANDTNIIYESQIRQILSDLTYPLCFYDYESINVPIPLMDQTHPYQQVVVQYSLHKLYSDGTMRHYGGVMWWQGEHRVEQIQIPHNPNLVVEESEKIIYGHYSDVLREFLIDIGDDIHDSTFIVWHQPFENTRNKEIAEIFPDLADDFFCINEHTYDLKEIFSKGLYFDIQFQWSSSIKKVLPVLTDISYDDLDIGNGALAMKELVKLINNQIADEDQRRRLAEDLLIYCGQDSLAMVRIYQELLDIVALER